MKAKKEKVDVFFDLSKKYCYNQPVL